MKTNNAAQNMVNNAKTAGKKEYFVDAEMLTADACVEMYREACAAGDAAMAATAERALNGSLADAQIVADAINAARASAGR